MGLFDSLASKALGSILGGQQGAEGGADLSGLIGSVMSGKVDLAETVGQVMNSVGGLPGLQEKFQQSGLGEQFASWVGTGENQPIAPEQLEQAVGGSDALAGLVSKLGVDVKSVTPLLATLLPVIIDKLTPKGEVDQANAQGEGLQQALSGLLSGGNLTSVIGSVMGNSGGLGGLVGGLLGGNKA